MDLVIVLSTQEAVQHVAPPSCKSPSTHSCLHIYLTHKGEGVFPLSKGNKKEVGFVYLFFVAFCYLNVPGDTLFLRQRFRACKKEQNAVHTVSRWNSPSGFDLTSVPKTNAKRWNINRVKGTGIRWIAMAALSNAPFSASLSFGTSHQGSNSNCQQQPFTYLSSQSTADSIHFTSGIFVSPSLFSHCAECVSVCMDAVCTYSMFLCVFGVFVHRCVHARECKTKQYLHRCLPSLSWQPRVCYGLWRFCSGGACEGLPR